MKTNARIIAASPDLLEAAKELDEHAIPHMNGVSMVIRKQDWAKLRAAIEKAIGKQ